MWGFQIQDFLMILFIRNYLILYVSDWSVHVTCSAIFPLETAKCPILDLYPWHWNHQLSMKTVIHVLFWYPLIYCNFSLRNALLSLFPNVNSTPQHHQQPSLSFSIKFPLLYSYSLFSKATPFTFGNAHWILKTAPQTSSPTVSSMPLCFHYFSLFHCFFFIEHSHTFHLWKCALYSERIAQHHHQQWAPYPMFFLRNFPYFIAVFHLQKHPFLFESGPLDPENSAQCCHQQWAPLLSSPMHPKVRNKCLKYRNGGNLSLYLRVHVQLSNMTTQI